MNEHEKDVGPRAKEDIVSVANSVDLKIGEMLNVLKSIDEKLEAMLRAIREINARG